MMRVRGMDANGDMAFGKGGQNYLADSPSAVAQSIQTRLGLWTGQWFLDVTEGTPWPTDVLGKGAQATKDMAIRKRILTGPGVTAIATYSSSIDASRKMAVSGTVQTEFSETAAFEG